MRYEINELASLLSRTPSVVCDLLKDLPEELVRSNEGGDTWTPFDVVGHLIHGEKTDWIPRAKIILGDDADKTFEPFDRFAQFVESEGKPLADLLDEFEALRTENLRELASMDISEEDLKKTGIHPELGEVTLSELLATWAAHDLDHIVQISRTIANQYGKAVGPWKAYLRVLQKT
ncbi:MAG: DinB family protein [Acidobacteriota bacterium]|nr:MAG: DinB family protein [Acidobacteriota bacterium]